MQTELKFEIESKSSLWTKYFNLMLVYSFLTSTTNYLMITAAPLYAIHLGGDNSIAGLMMGIFMIAAILVRPYFGKLLDEKSRRVVLIAGAAICTLTYFSYLFAFSIGMLILIRAINGIGFSANTNASGTVVSDVIPKDRLAEGVGYYGIANTLSTAIGPSIALFIIKNYNYNILFIFTAFLGILSILVSYLIDYEKNNNEEFIVISKSSPNKNNNTTSKKSTNMIFEKTALPVALVMVFLAVTIGGIMTFVPTYAATRGIDDISSYFTVYALALLITRLFVGKMADKYGVSMAIIPGIILVIIAFIVLAFAKSLPVFLLSATLYGLGYGSSQPTLNAVMIKLCPPERRGAGNSTFYTAMDIGSGGGAMLWGVISQSFGFQSVYLTCAASVGISLLCYLFILKKQIT